MPRSQSPTALLTQAVSLRVASGPPAVPQQPLVHDQGHPTDSFGKAEPSNRKAGKAHVHPKRHLQQTARKQSRHSLSTSASNLSTDQSSMPKHPCEECEMHVRHHWLEWATLDAVRMFGKHRLVPAHVNCCWPRLCLGAAKHQAPQSRRAHMPSQPARDLTDRPAVQKNPESTVCQRYFGQVGSGQPPELSRGASLESH